jgi:hypothetical protein
MHIRPEGDSIVHTETADCQCNPSAHTGRGGTLYNHHPTTGTRPGRPSHAGTGIMLKVAPPCPIETALIEWMRCADLSKEGQITHAGVNLVGSRENAARYAKLIADHIKTNGHDVQALTDHLLHPQGAGKHVKVYSFAAHVAEGAIEALRRKGLVP